MKTHFYVVHPRTPWLWISLGGSNIGSQDRVNPRLISASRATEPFKDFMVQPQGDAILPLWESHLRLAPKIRAKFGNVREIYLFVRFRRQVIPIGS